MIEQLPLLPILLFSVILHEIAHGWMALRLGDPTAKEMGRLTLNPIPHIDLIGSIIVPLLSLVSAGRIFIAWAKPVPVNPLNFTNGRRDDLLVSVVGPITNLLIAAVCTILLAFLDGIFPHLPASDGMLHDALMYVFQMLAGGITLNIVLAVFNLIPIPPLDGSHVLASLLPPRLASGYRRIGFSGIFLLLLLMSWAPFAGFFDAIIRAVQTPFGELLRILR